MLTKFRDTDNNLKIRHMFYEDESKVMQLGYDVSEVIYKGMTKMKQEVIIFDSVAFGRTLVIDGMVQNSVNTEFVYNEMMVHMPLDCQLKPESVLIIGGGSGLTVNQVLKYASVRHIDLCDISREIIDLCEQYFPAYYTHELLSSELVNIHICDGSEFVKYKTNIDAIIVDCCDPIGCADVLYSDGFYLDCIHALSDNGILCVQCGSPLFEQGKLEYRNLHNFLNSHKYEFAYEDVLFTCPMIVGGYYMFTLISKSPLHDVNESYHMMPHDCEYYNPNFRDQYFEIPNFIKEGLGVK